ncbi:lysozyme family protein [Alkalihalobacillus sp. LMS39]|uniref:lysozyme family protein n=1 Tax=Alkalihalobacillus sp. LMS39 TaxID=2924032 RepID=UPI001FB25AE1|nr:lysozyme family protein [Alkalihalobacillus sp. LMS39]UOE94777.1 lysozyme family protein [Alkalihalobacillus sp. LMS39]
MALKKQYDNSQKLQPQLDEKIKPTKKKSGSSILAKETVKSTSDKIVKSSVNKYSQELQRDDVGVEVVGKTTEVVTKVGKKVNTIRKEKKLKQKNSDIKLVKKRNSSDNFIKKLSKQPTALSTKAIKRGVSNYKKQLEKDDVGVEVVGKGATLTKEGVKTLERANKIRKHRLNQEKLQGMSTKLSGGNQKLSTKQSQKSKLTKNAKSQLKKKVMKRKLYANKGKQKAISAISGGIKTFFKSIGTKASLTALKSMLGTKLAVGAGALFIKLTPIFLVCLLLFSLIAFFMFGGGGVQQQIEAEIGTSRNLSPEVEQWRDLVMTEAEAQGMSDYVNLVLAIIQVESGGRGTRDIMQSSESAGYPRNYYQTEEESVRQGIKYLKHIVLILKGYEKGYENNAKLIAQSYNFGAPFAHYVGNLGGEFDLEVAEAYSLTVVAPSLGNTTGETYPYVNEISVRLGKPYLYRNGGNFMYGELVGQYIINTALSGDFAIVMEELLKYQGTPYVWGGKTPDTGFDCSGLVAWGLKQIGINLPSPAAAQFHNTIPIDIEDAQPGDLIFFRGTYGGPNHISHVGFYIDETTMYDSNSNGVGYTDWKLPYWQHHFLGIRRVVK